MKKFAVILLALFFVAGCGPDFQENNKTQNDSGLNLDMNFAEAVEQSLPYKNKKYVFGLKEFPEDFKIEQLENDAGIVFKKLVQLPPGENSKDPSFDYTAEIYVMPFENIESYKDLSEFVGRKYAGYTFEFVDYGEFNGYYVNESVASNAVSHFYSMSKDGETIYEIYLKVPGKYYAAQKETFENVVGSVVFF